MKSTSGPPATLGSTAVAHLRLIVWCLDCRHQVEPDPAEMAERYGAAMTLQDWCERLRCSLRFPPLKTATPRQHESCDRQGNQGQVGEESSKASPAKDGEAEISKRAPMIVMSINLGGHHGHQAWTTSLHMS
jgi:hypothetical protein